MSHIENSLASLKMRRARKRGVDIKLFSSRKLIFLLTFLSEKKLNLVRFAAIFILPPKSFCLHCSRRGDRNGQSEWVPLRVNQVQVTQFRGLSPWHIESWLYKALPAERQRPSAGRTQTARLRSTAPTEREIQNCSRAIAVITNNDSTVLTPLLSLKFSSKQHAFRTIKWTEVAKRKNIAAKKVTQNKAEKTSFESKRNICAIWERLHFECGSVRAAKIHWISETLTDSK